MASALWNLRKKLSNDTRKTLRGIANTVGIGKFLPLPDEERLKREEAKEARKLGLEEEVADVEEFANILYLSQQAMRNLGQDETTVKEFSQQDFNQWKTQMEKKGKHWESALKLFLKYRGKFFWVAGLQNAYESTKYDPHGHFNPTYIKSRSGLGYINKLEQMYKGSVITPEYTELHKFMNYSPHLPHAPVFIQQPPIVSPSFPQLGRGKRGRKTRKTRKTKRKH